MKLERIIKNIDILKYVYLSVTLFAYYKGYMCYLSGNLGLTAGWSLCCAAGLLVSIQRIRYLHFLHMKIEKVDRLSGKEFENYLTAQMKKKGYRVVRTDDSHDYGADLVLKRRGESIVVQAKRYDRNVGLAAVQEAAGAVAYYGADRAMVVTNSHFTSSARNLARQNDVELWGREEIIREFGMRECR